MDAPLVGLAVGPVLDRRAVTGVVVPGIANGSIGPVEAATRVGPPGSGPVDDPVDDQHPARAEPSSINPQSLIQGLMNRFYSWLAARSARETAVVRGSPSRTPALLEG